MKNKTTKSIKTNNKEEIKEKKVIYKNVKEKEKKGKKDNIIKSNIENKIHNIRNNVNEKIKLYTKSIEQRIDLINTESIFKTKKSNNYRPITSKNNNSNPFRVSARGTKEITTNKKIFG